MAANLKNIRQQISKLTAEHQRTAESLLPVDLLEQKLRAHLANLAEPLDTFIDNCAHVLNGGDSYYTTPATPPMLARAAFGISLTPEKIETIVKAAKARALASDAGQMRLSTAEKAERLADLNSRIYTLGLEEQEALGDEPQRSDVNGACVLRIPVEVAIAFDLI